jgi:pimeloyl-ACP methyl ester carboxylesterase
MSASQSIHPFTLSIPSSTLDDLQTRLRMTRWPDKEIVTDWSQGVPLATIQELCEYWQTTYNWRRCEQLLNSYPQFTTVIDGVEFYFLHIRSKHSNALPMLLTHGWPGSVLEFRHVIDKLINPGSHGGSSQDAFHLVIPALPGYAFSSKPKESGWEIGRTARAWAELMQRLGYADSGWVAQGGDWGAHVTASLGHQAPKGLKSVHMNSIYLEPKVKSAIMCQLKTYANGFCRKRLKLHPKTRRGKNEPCVWTAIETRGTTDTTSSSQRDRKPLATGLLTHQLRRPLGFTKSLETGPITTETSRRCLVKMRCWTQSCCIGCLIPEHRLLVIIGSVSLTPPRGQLKSRLA